MKTKPVVAETDVPSDETTAKPMYRTELPLSGAPRSTGNLAASSSIMRCGDERVAVEFGARSYALHQLDGLNPTGVGKSTTKNSSFALGALRDFDS